MTDPSTPDDDPDAASSTGGQPAEFIDSAGNAPGGQMTDPEPPGAEEIEKGKRRSGEAPVADS
jgi:hypothetical protein